MSVTIERGFNPADRYLYDFKRLTYARGWAQLDTRMDASYYGTWINPELRQIFNYCEGDTCLTTCETDAELVAEVESIRQWADNVSPDGFRGIDPGFGAEMRERFENAGLGGYLHGARDVERETK